MSDQEWKPELDEVEMMKILIKGTLMGIPFVFVVEVLVMLLAKAPSSGVFIISAWGALIGGTFIGCAIMLAKRLGELGLAEHLPPKQAESQQAESQVPAQPSN